MRGARELARYSRWTIGFDFHTIDSAPYWVESAYYAFTLEQIERDIEAPTAELEACAASWSPRRSTTSAS